MSQIELHSVVSNRQLEFTHNLLLPQIKDIFQEIVDKRIDNADLSVEAVFEEYLQTSKKFGDINKDELLFYTTVCLAFAKDKRTSKEFKADAFELAASMIWETAFLDTVDSHNSLNGVDERIELVDAGSTFLQHAATLVQNDDMERVQRLLVKNLFTQAMRDVVAGEVTSATRDELLLSIRDARSQLKFITSSTYRSGLLGELLTLEKFWLSYAETGDKVALPVTFRGGYGKFRTDETHDIDVLRQRRDKSWIVLTPVEVKNQKITDDILNRYTKSHIANIAVNGTVSINGDHRTTAV